MPDENQPLVPVKPVTEHPITSVGGGQGTVESQVPSAPISPVSAGVQPQPAVASAVPQPQPQPLTPEQRKALEVKAKNLITEIEKTHPKPASTTSPPPAGPVKKRKPVAAMLTALALFLLIGGGFVGIKMLGIPGSQDTRQQAAVRCRDYDGTNQATCTNADDCCRWQSSDQTCRVREGCGGGGGTTCPAGLNCCSNPVAPCNEDACFNAETVVALCHEGTATGPTCWKVVDICEESDCYAGECDQLPLPGVAERCEGIFNHCEEPPVCLSSSELVKKCWRDALETDQCWDVVAVCLNNACVNGQCTQGTTTPTPHVTYTPMPGPSPTGGWQCGHFGGTNYSITACGACNDGDDPRNASVANGSGFGCRSAAPLAHCVCDGTVGDPVQGCGPINGTCTQYGPGTVTFSRDCGMEQIDTSGATHSTITVFHDEPCDTSPTRPPGGNPTNTPVPGVTTPLTATVTPQVLACTTIGYSDTNPNYGETVTLTCTGNPSSRVNRAEYQVSVANGAWTSVPVNADNKTASLTINQIGNYRVRCRVCEDNTDGTACTAWQ